MDKKKFVLSNPLSQSSNGHWKSLAGHGNIYNGKLYDEKDVRTVKMEQKKLSCELADEEKSANVAHDDMTMMVSTIPPPPSPPVITCSDNVVKNVVQAASSLFNQDGAATTNLEGNSLLNHQCVDQKEVTSDFEKLSSNCGNDIRYVKYDQNI